MVVSIKKIVKWILGIPIILLLVLNISGCFQFRKSNEKKIKAFEKKELTLIAQTYTFQNRIINYVQTNFSDSTLPVTIFVHGSPGSSQDFFKTMQDSIMQANFEMLSIDRPGFGHSGFGKSEPSLENQALLLEPLIDKYAGRKIILVGHSYGGPVVARAAMLFDHKIHATLILAGSVSPEAEPEEWWRKPMDWALIRWIFPRAMTVSNQEIMPLKSELIRIEQDWSKITKNLSVIQGEKDFLVPAENADYIEDKAINSIDLRILRYSDLNHFIPFTSHELITEELIKLIE